MDIPWRKLLTKGGKLLLKGGKWMLRKGAEEALKDLQKRKERGQL